MKKLFLTLLLITISNFSLAKTFNIENIERIDLKNKNIYSYSSLAIGSSFLLDQAVYDFSQNNQSENANIFFDIVNPFGGRTVPLSLSASLYLTGKLISNKKLEHSSAASFQAIAYSGIITACLKTIIGRARPYVNGEPSYFKPINTELKESFHSFPSGHSTAAWAFITPYAENYNKALYILPASVSLARIYKNKHWLSDVVAGGIIGYISGRIINQKF